MHLQTPILNLLLQLADLLQQLSDEAYDMPMPLLSGATIGQHYRHVLECFQELEKGYYSGTVNYDLRKRDHRLETDRSFALRQISLTGRALEKSDRPLGFQAAFAEEIEVNLSSTYYRELMHNLDHMVHHMALVRVGLSSLPGIQLPEDFGIAFATLQFRANSHSIHQN